MKPFYKIVENNLISGFGTNGPDTVMEITEAEYSEIVSMFRNRPTAPEGYAYVLQDEPMEWVLVELPPAPVEPITEEEALVRYANEITGAHDETLQEATETLIKLRRNEQ